MTPDYRISIAGQQVSTQLRARLESLTLNDRRGMQADELTLTLTDDDGMLDIPRRGVEVVVAIGWKGAPLTERGTFIVDEVEHAGAPDTLTVRASAANMRKGLPGKRTQSYDDTTVGDIVATVAARHELEPAIGKTLKGIAVEHIDQTDESDLHFLTRLAEKYDAMATVKHGRLIVMPKSRGTTAGGSEIPPMELQRQSGDSHTYTNADRDDYTGVIAQYYDKDEAERLTVTAGSEENAQQLRHTYATREDAEAAARAEWEKIQRSDAELSITLAVGNPELTPETPVNVRGFKPAIDATPWVAREVTHTITGADYTSAVSMEVRG